MNRNESRKSVGSVETPILTTPSSLKLSHKGKAGNQTPSKSGATRAKYLTKKDAYDKAEKYTKKNDTNAARLVPILDDISEFNSNALSTFNPLYVEFEQQLSNSLDNLQEQVERIQALKEGAVSLRQNFETHISDSKVAFDTGLEEIRQWQPPTEKLEAMQERAIRLKEILAHSKEKLARIDGELKLAEERNNKENQQVRATITSTQFILVVLVLFASYYLFF